MSKPYSDDLRQRVVASVEQEGLSRRQAAARYDIGISTVIRWVVRFRGTGSVSPGKIGGLGANMALRQTLVFVDVPVMQQPEAYIGGAAELFGDDGTVRNADTAKFLAAYMAAFAQWVAKLAA